MRVHPVLLRLEDRACVVVGGDAAAEPKIRALLDAGAVVTVIAPELTDGLMALAAAGRLTHQPRAYRDGDLCGATLAYASTRDRTTIAALGAEAARERVLLNVIDVPDACQFISPAVVRRGDLTIAIGTGGASPGLSAQLRARLAAEFGPEYGPYVEILRAVRTALWDQPTRAAVVTSLVDSALLDLVRRGDRAGIDALLGEIAGREHTLERLGVALDGEA